MTIKEIQKIVGVKQDGIMGPKTKAAIKSYQSQLGVTSDGVWGPKTQAAYDKKSQPFYPTPTGKPIQPKTPFYPTPTGQPIKKTEQKPKVEDLYTPPPQQSQQQAQQNQPTGTSVTFNGQTFNTTPETADFLNNAIIPFMNQMQQQGLAINPDLNLGSNEIAQILEKAKTTVHPQYAQQIAGVQEDLARNTELTKQAYESQIANQQQGFQGDLGSAREGFAGAGLTFSGQRGKGEFGMQEAQNRNLSALSSQYGNRLSEFARGAEQQLGTAGMGGFQLPTLRGYSSSLGGEGGFNQTGNINTGYTPGTYALGEIPQSEAAAALALRNQNVQEASRRKAAGLSYADLYS